MQPRPLRVPLPAPTPLPRARPLQTAPLSVSAMARPNWVINHVSERDLLPVLIVEIYSGPVHRAPLARKRMAVFFVGRVSIADEWMFFLENVIVLAT